MGKVDLRLDWCSYEAAKYAVEHWHYSKSLPASKRVCVGVWENNRFIGAVIFAWGANNNLARSFGLHQTECCELCRVALSKHETPVSKIVSIALKMLKKQSPGLRLVVSYADTRYNHHGGIYQAMNWIYIGRVKSTPDYFVDGRWMRQRQVNSRFGTIKGFMGKKRKGSDKHKYLFPLDDAMRKQIETLRKPYPERERGETDSAPGTNREIGGASPTRSLLSQQNVRNYE